MPLHEAVTTHHNASQEERAFVLSKVYQQVLERQPYEFEHRQLSDLEKEFLKGKIGIRHFLKSLAVRPIYLEHFYENSSNIKFIENACKHFLGRAPKGNEEIHAWDEILVRHGVGALVSALVDSEEYRKAFGYFTVPYWREHSYESASEYLENEQLGHEYAGQRGWGVPTHYQHELHIDCDGGVCHPEGTAIESKSESTSLTVQPETVDVAAAATLSLEHIERLYSCLDEMVDILYSHSRLERNVSRKTIEKALKERIIEYMSSENAKFFLSN